MSNIRKRFRFYKRIIRVLCRLIYRTCTQKMRVLPGFFVLGPPRSGTSALNHYIAQHPAYIKPFMKELGYSADPIAKKAPHAQFNFEIYQHLPAALRKPVMWAMQGLYFQNGANGYRKLFPLASAMKRRARRHDGAITGDYTVFGLYKYATTQAFPQCLTGDGAKYITILRDPVEYLFSFYTLETKGYFADINDEVISFDRYIRHPEELYPDGSFVRIMDMFMNQWRPVFEQHPCFDESRYTFATFMISYVVFIKHWARAVPEDRLLVLSFTDLCERTQDTMNTVFDFLEVARFEVPDVQQVNANVYTQKTVSEEAISYIRDYARPFNEELYQFLGRDFGWDDGKA